MSHSGPLQLENNNQSSYQTSGLHHNIALAADNMNIYSDFRRTMFTTLSPLFEAFSPPLRLPLLRSLRFRTQRLSLRSLVHDIDENSGTSHTHPTIISHTSPIRNQAPITTNVIPTPSFTMPSKGKRKNNPEKSDRLCPPL